MSLRNMITFYSSLITLLALAVFGIIASVVLNQARIDDLRREIELHANEALEAALSATEDSLPVL